jgi:hypothetical protein
MGWNERRGMHGEPAEDRPIRAKAPPWKGKGISASANAVDPWCPISGPASARGTPVLPLKKNRRTFRLGPRPSVGQNPNSRVREQEIYPAPSSDPQPDPHSGPNGRQPRRKAPPRGENLSRFSPFARSAPFAPPERIEPRVYEMPATVANKIVRICGNG